MIHSRHGTTQCAETIRLHIGTLRSVILIMSVSSAKNKGEKRSAESSVQMRNAESASNGKTHRPHVSARN